jgi:hypothetical protein
MKYNFKQEHWDKFLSSLRSHSIGDPLMESILQQSRFVGTEGVDDEQYIVLSIENSSAFFQDKVNDAFHLVKSEISLSDNRHGDLSWNFKGIKLVERKKIEVIQQEKTELEKRKEEIKIFEGVIVEKRNYLRSKMKRIIEQVLIQYSEHNDSWQESLSETVCRFNKKAQELLEEERSFNAFVEKAVEILRQERNREETIKQDKEMLKRVKDVAQDILDTCKDKKDH